MLKTIRNKKSLPAISLISLLGSFLVSGQCQAYYVFSYQYNVTTSTTAPINCEGALWYEVGVNWALGDDCLAPLAGPFGIVRGFCYQSTDFYTFYPTYSNAFSLQAVSWNNPVSTC
ncbi:MAG: hypothetical protein WDO68_22025 [Gammaproteobacteria bacterium]